LLAVLVLSYNKREAALKCLDSVARLRYQPRRIVVVDNGSDDGSADAIARAHPDVCLVRSSTNLGAAGGRNFGIRWITERFNYSYLLFLDDDASVDDGLADELAGALRADPQAGLATPKAYRAGAPGVIASAGGMRVRLWRGSIVDLGAGEADRGQYDQPRTVDSCVGFTVLARREALERVGGFDDAFNPYGWEEVDFSLRVRQAGYRIVYVPTAVGWHAGGTPGRGHRVSLYERGKSANFFRLLRRHARPLEWLVLGVTLPIRAAGLVLRDALRGDWAQLGARWAGALDALGRRPH
jgi:GT2 family glycosyltransferase